MAVAMLSGNGRWGSERQDRAEARATGQYEPVSNTVYQGQQAPPQAEDYTIGPDGLAVRSSKRGSRML